MRRGLARLDQFSVMPLMFVAAVLLVGGCEAGGSSSGARGQSGPPMTLTLSAAKKICETKPGQGYIANEWREDDDGNEVSVDVYTGWAGVAEIDIGWTVSGGTGPYELEIDGETRDPAHEYKGATGTASVSCALTTGETYIDDDGDRRYMADPPRVDSGLKTIRATVTDAAGTTAEATLDIYVVLIVESSFVELRGGETYRVNGFLITIPKGVDMETGGYEESACEGEACEDGFQLYTVGDGYEAGIWLGASSGTERARRIWVDDRPRGAGEERHPIEGKLDELVESIGQLPQISLN